MPDFHRAGWWQGIGLLVVLTAFMSAAAADPGDSKSQGGIVLLPPPPVGDGAMPSGGLHLPGREYRAGDGWWQLNCSNQCELVNARLSITSLPHPQYDGPDVPGQLLQFTPMPTTSTLLVFKPWRGAAGRLPLVAGPITTYHPTPSLLRRSRTPGTMEGEIPLPSGSVALLAPTRLLPDPSLPAKEPWDSSTHVLSLDLSLDGKRQTLGAFSFGIDGEAVLKPAEYLRWAGDLDGDGKLDLLVSLDYSDGSDLVLFLSSLAAEGEIVGEAGRFTYFPIDAAGC